MNQNFTLPAFAEPITALPDTPQCPASELKRRLQAPAEELRQVHNALAETVEGITSATYPKTVTRGMLAQEVQEELESKAEQSALDNEVNARQNADASLQTQIAAKCEVVLGTYTGNGAASQTVTLGFQPRALFTTNRLGRDGLGSYAYGGLAFPGIPSTCCTITQTGFTVSNAEDGNNSNVTYKYIALK